MSKAILVLDKMPRNCSECPCCIKTKEEKKAIGFCNTSDDDYYCKKLERFMEYDKVDGGLDILGKPSDCPLKQAPEPKEYIEAQMIGDVAYNQAVSAYNKALEDCGVIE